MLWALMQTLPMRWRTSRDFAFAVLFAVSIGGHSTWAAGWAGVPRTPAKPIRAAAPRSDKSEEVASQTANEQARTPSHWAILNLSNAQAWSQKPLDERISLLHALVKDSEQSTVLLAVRLPPSGRALCDAVIALLSRATTADEKLRIAPLLPLDVAECEEAQLNVCNEVAPAPADNQSTLPSAEKTRRNGCLQTPTRTERALLKNVANALQEEVSMKSIFRAAGENISSLVKPLEQCILNESQAYSSARRQECLSLLVAVDVKKANELLSRDDVWFVTSVKHFELSAAVARGESPLHRLIAIGMIPAGFTLNPWESHYPRDILSAANVLLEFYSWNEQNASLVLKLGKSALSNARLTLDTDKKRLTVWFNGERADVRLQGDAHQQLVTAAGLFNFLAERARVPQRWWVHAVDNVVMVGAEASLKQAVTERLVYTE